MTARSAESARREFLKRVVAGGVYFGAGSLGLPSYAARPIACLPTSPRAYRNSRPYLFQSVPSRTIANRLPGGGAYLWDIYGPTYRYVDYETGWLWSQPGGDWLDRNFVRFGSAPWFSVPVGAVTGSSAVASYSVDVSAVLQLVFSARRWCALLLQRRNAERVIAGMSHPQYAPPVINVTYVGGAQAQLRCRMVAVNSSGSTGPYTVGAEVPLPAFVEFERPQAAVQSASLSFTITQHWSGTNPTLEGFLLDPPTTTATGATDGVASTAGRLDQSIEQNPAVIGAHRYVDGTQASDFIYGGYSNFGVERSYDPAIYGTGPTDLSKFPHAGLGKWVVGGSPLWSLVNSTYAGEGFAPLAPGLGAMRIVMPAEPGVQDGSVVGYSGTLAAHGMIFLPETLFGRLNHIFVRYYFRLGAPYAAPVARRYQVLHDTSGSPNSIAWTDYSGKFGIGPDHTTSYGGVSGSSGGGKGWQLRSSWADCDAGVGGPDEGGWCVGHHMYDYLVNNPPGYNYGATWGPEERWGQLGGIGGVLYAGQWYCIETELKLNSILSTAPGFLPDGELRTWIDGQLAYQRTGMVFRLTPDQYPYNSELLRPCRELGVRGLWLNWFHGGKTLATIDRTTFYTGLVWSTQYIGPMKLT